MNTLGSHVYECHPGYAGNEQNCTGEFNLFPKYSWHNWLQRRTIQPRSLITRNISSGFSWRRWNFYFVSRVESSSNFLRVDFPPKFTSRKHNFMLPCVQKRIIFWLCFKWFNNLTRTFTWCRHKTLRELKNLQESQTFKDSLIIIIIIAAMILIWLMQTDEWVASNRILVFSQRFLGTPRGKHYNSLEINVWRKAVSRSKETFTKRDHRFFLPLLYHNWSG